MEGIEDLSTAISIYLNPTRGTSRITGDAIGRIQVLNSVGAVLHDYTMPTAVSYYDIDMSNYGKGTYIIYITTKHGTTSHKLVKM